MYGILVFISVMLNGRLAAFIPSLTPRSLDYRTLHLTLLYRFWPFMLSMPYQTASPSWGQLDLSALPCSAVPAWWLCSLWIPSRAPAPSGFSRLCGFALELLLTPVSCSSPPVPLGAPLRSGSCWVTYLVSPPSPLPEGLSRTGFSNAAGTLARLTPSPSSD